MSFQESKDVQQHRKKKYNLKFTAAEFIAIHEYCNTNSDIYFSAVISPEKGQSTCMIRTDEFKDIL